MFEFAYKVIWAWRLLFRKICIQEVNFFHRLRAIKLIFPTVGEFCQFVVSGPRYLLPNLHAEL